MIVICVDGRVQRSNEIRTLLTYMTAAEGAVVNPHSWMWSDERAMVAAYDPQHQFVIHFVWVAGPDNFARWDTYVWGAEIELNDELIMSRTETPLPGSEAAREFAAKTLAALAV